MGWLHNKTGPAVNFADSIGGIFAPRKPNFSLVKKLFLNLSGHMVDISEWTNKRRRDTVSVVV